ncbi:MAG: hypothetical protein UX35_C0001G0076 [Microgenomates group bacterium GW2011_GWA1_46_15]|nr:MAG: hypothetical protein UX00_C0003G0015 [Microgenomates group bacterium GW2011_GWB1_45_17]KKU24179.1 MAG: hypothetical protein UX36_C0002G0162 [Microgenomates group bacterium GW2011_GWC1_46_15]KKU24894.1 MAG: hypothetical protein UX35_C0001G0076 [Microgenomates group bacterium GW2011_GWA1_46_15]
MSNTTSPYRKSKKIFYNAFCSCYVYWMKPGRSEPKHFHKGIEIECVLKGNCETHKQGKLYLRKKNQIHEGVNDSKKEVVFVCFTIPPESKENTVYMN